MWSTWGASPWEGKSGAEVGIVNRKVARRARAGQTFPQRGRLSSTHRESNFGFPKRDTACFEPQPLDITPESRPEGYGAHARRVQAVVALWSSGMPFGARRRGCHSSFHWPKGARSRCRLFADEMVVGRRWWGGGQWTGSRRFGGAEGASALCSHPSGTVWAPRLCTATLYSNSLPRPYTTTLYCGCIPRLPTATLHRDSAPQLCTATLSATLCRDHIPQCYTAAVYRDSAPQLYPYSLRRLSAATVYHNTILRLYTVTLHRDSVPLLSTATLCRDRIPQHYTAAVYRDSLRRLCTVTLYRDCPPFVRPVHTACACSADGGGLQTQADGAG